MLYFTTYFDKNYLSRGLALYNSLKENSQTFQLFVLCLDNHTEVYFKTNQQKFPEVKTLLLNDIEDDDIELKSCKTNRNNIEYYFTLSPCLPLYLLNTYKLPHICSLDADILFFANPKPIFDYLNDYSVVITPHKFSKEIVELEKFGKFNVSFQIFKNDENGIACLKKWRQQCIEWCSDTFDKKNDRYADQKYLDKWALNFPNKVKELYDNVSGIAPWNLNHYKLTIKDKQVYSNNERLIFYHFHHFKIFNTHIATNGFYFYKAKDSRIINHLYLQYWNNLEVINKEFNIEKDNIQRTHLAGNNSIYKKLLDEGSAYFRQNNRFLMYADFQTIKGKVLKYLIKFYA